MAKDIRSLLLVGSVHESLSFPRSSNSSHDDRDQHALNKAHQLQRLDLHDSSLLLVFRSNPYLSSVKLKDPVPSSAAFCRLAILLVRRSAPCRLALLLWLLLDP